MGPSQICGCPFREPRVFKIAHLCRRTPVNVYVHAKSGHQLVQFVMYSISRIMDFKNKVGRNPNHSNPHSWLANPHDCCSNHIYIYISTPKVVGTKASKNMMNLNVSNITQIPFFLGTSRMSLANRNTIWTRFRPGASPRCELANKAMAPLPSNLLKSVFVLKQDGAHEPECSHVC